MEAKWINQVECIISSSSSSWSSSSSSWSCMDDTPLHFAFSPYLFALTINFSSVCFHNIWGFRKSCIFMELYSIPLLFLFPSAFSSTLKYAKTERIKTLSSSSSSSWEKACFCCSSRLYYLLQGISSSIHHHIYHDIIMHAWLEMQKVSSTSRPKCAME